MRISKSQIDRIGDRLKEGRANEQDLVVLDRFRESHTEAYESVVPAINRSLLWQITGRESKTTTSITRKLQRQSIKLSQIQDIAGCRIVVPDLLEQQTVLSWLLHLFPGARMVDRREKPSHGYRAIHVIPRILGKQIEVQIRTSLQHQWAMLSERFSDLIDPEIKYGGGNPEIARALLGDF